MLPCGAEVDMAVQIGLVFFFFLIFLFQLNVYLLIFFFFFFRSSEQLLPMHPLDVNPTMEADPSQCFGSFIPQSSVLPDT